MNALSQLPPPSAHGCHNGWVYELTEGALTVKDRCMICNEPSWYAERRRANTGCAVAVTFVFVLIASELAALFLHYLIWGT